MRGARGHVGYFFSFKTFFFKEKINFIFFYLCIYLFLIYTFNLYKKKYILLNFKYITSHIYN